MQIKFTRNWNAGLQFSEARCKSYLKPFLHQGLSELQRADQKKYLVLIGAIIFHNMAVFLSDENILALSKNILTAQLVQCLERMVSLINSEEIVAKILKKHLSGELVKVNQILISGLGLSDLFYFSGRIGCEIDGEPKNIPFDLNHAADLITSYALASANEAKKRSF
jgi:hypothetical protein